MAIFSNRATLTFNGTQTNSNIAYGEIIEVISADKTAIEGSYSPGELVSYAVTIRNTAAAPLNGISVTDDLGAYASGAGTVYPLAYSEGSATLFIDGILQPSPAVTAGPPLVVSGINLPGGSDAVLVYQARVTAFADPAAGGSITNTAAVTFPGQNTPIEASETVFASTDPDLTIAKSISPAQIVDNGRVTYTFTIQNTGNREAVATDDAAITDLFSPVLSAVSVIYNGTPWTEGVEYNYDEATGLFTTVPGQITVPAATYMQDPVTGEYTVTPGISALVVTGTI